jgi:hypothetical protein
MKWMGWSWAEYLDTPIRVVREARSVMREQAAAMKKITER